MPRRTNSPTMLIVNFFMNAPVAEAKQALDTAKAIVASREAAGLVQPNLPKPRKRRERRPRQEALPGATAATTATTAAPGPVAVPDAPKQRRRRGAGARPAVADTAASATALPPVPAGVDLAALPAPTE